MASFGSVEKMTNRKRD